MAVPGGGSVSGLLGPQLKSVFNNNPRMSAVIDQTLKGSTDKLSTAQTDALKKQLAAALGSDQAALEDFRTNASNFINKAVLNGVPANDSSAQALVKGDIQAVLTNIDDNRK